MSQTSSPDSQAQDKAHNQAHWDMMAPRWKAWWYRYGPASQPVSDYLVAQANLAPGARVLDLATGLGEPALSFARAIGPRGLVLGVDQAAKMIEFAREMAAEAGLANTRFEVQDVEHLALPNEEPFDALVSRWGLMFCTDVVATLKRARDYLRPDARLVAAVWSRPEQVPMLELAGRVMKASLNIDLSRPGPGPFTLSDEANFQALIRQAGFRPRALEPVAVVLDYASAQEFLQDRAMTSPILEDTLAGLSAEQRSRFDAALEAAVDPWRHAEGIRLVNQALCLTAVKAC